MIEEKEGGSSLVLSCPICGRQEGQRLGLVQVHQEEYTATIGRSTAEFVPDSSPVSPAVWVRVICQAHSFELGLWCQGPLTLTVGVGEEEEMSDAA